MRFLSLKPSASLSEPELQSGLRWLTLQGTVAMGLDAVTSGGFLAAYALALGANNFQIGLLAALPFMMQPLQLPAILLIERIGARKAISFFTFGAIQLLWVPIALIPFMLDLPSPGAMSLLLGLIALRSLITAPLNAAWNGWLKDLIPQKIMGTFFARRLVFASAVGIALSIGAGLFADIWLRRDDPSLNSQSLAYALPILFGALTLGVMTPIALLGMPEPQMVQPPGGRRSLWKALANPFKDPNYRNMITFRFLWAFALNLAVPFFAVYMLDEIGLSVSMVMILTALSQGANILFLPVWGRMVDRLGAKGILTVCCSLYVLVVFGWTFTTLPDKYALTIPLLILLHVMAGVATAGLNVADGTLAFKLAPRGEATAYLAAASLAVNFGAALGPLLGGPFADFFASRHFTIGINYTSADSGFSLSPIDLTGFDFLFGIAFVLGIITLSRLKRVKEEGEASKDLVMEELMASTRHARPMSTVPGNSMLASFPLAHMRSPLPGLDIAIGLTAYEVSQAAHAATIAVGRGVVTTSKLMHGLEHAVAKVAHTGEHIGAQAMEVARAMSAGAARGSHEARVDVRSAAEASTDVVLRRLSRAGEYNEELLHAVAYGFLKGSAEAGGNMGEAARAVLQAARRAALRSGADPDSAARVAARAAIEATHTFGTATANAHVREVLWSDPAVRHLLMELERPKGPTGEG